MPGLRDSIFGARPADEEPSAFGRPAAAPTPQEMMTLEASGMSSLGRGWEAGRLGTEANRLAAQWSGLRAQGREQEAAVVEDQLRGLRQRQSLYAPRVNRVEQIPGEGLLDTLGNAGEWVAGQVGQGAASMVDPALAAAGATAAGRALQAAPNPLAKTVGTGLRVAGAPAAAYGINQEQLRGEFLNNARDDAALMERTSPQELDRTATAYGLGAGLLDTVIPAKAGAQVANIGVRKGAVAGFGRRQLTDMGIEGATELGQNAAGQQVLGYLNPDRDTSGDTMENVNAFLGGAVGGAPISAAGNLADTSSRAAGATADATKAGAQTAGKLAGQAKDAVAERMPADAMDAAIKGGELAGKGVTKMQELLRDFTSRDADEQALTAPQSKDTIKTTADLEADDQQRNTRAQTLAEKYLSGDYPQELKQAAQNYLAGSKVGEAWKELSAAAKDYTSSQRVQQGIKDFFTGLKDKVSDAVVNAEDLAAGAKAGYQIGRRENAQIPAMYPKSVREAVMPARDDFSAVLEREITPYIGQSERVAAWNAPVVSHGLRQWIASGFKGDKTEALHKMFEDPAAAVMTAYDLMKRQGLVKGEENDARLREVLADLQEQDATVDGRTMPIGQVVQKFMKPVEADKLRQLMGSNDFSEVGRKLVDRVARGTITKADLAEYFGDPDALLAALSAKLDERRTKLGVDKESDAAKSIAATDESNARRESADMGGPAAIEDVAGMTNSIDPNVVGEETKWHHYKGEEPFEVGKQRYDINKETGEMTPLDTHDQRADQLAGELRTVRGSDVKRVGYIDYLKERYADQPEKMVAEISRFMEAQKGKLESQRPLQPGEKRRAESPDAEINRRFFVLRESSATDKSERTNIDGAEFKSITPNSSGNRWAESVGVNGEYGDIGHGKIWFRRADGKEFATSASRIIKRMKQGAEQESGTKASTSLASQRKLLAQGIASLLTAKNPDGSYALKGQIGFMHERSGKIEWGSKDIPDGLRLHSSEGRTVADAKSAEQRVSLDEAMAAGRKELKRLKALGELATKIDELQAALKARDLTALWRLTEDAERSREGGALLKQDSSGEGTGRAEVEVIAEQAERAENNKPREYDELTGLPVQDFDRERDAATRERKEVASVVEAALAQLPRNLKGRLNRLSRVQTTVSSEFDFKPSVRAAAVYDSPEGRVVYDSGIRKPWYGYSPEKSAQVRLAHEAGHILDYRDGFAHSEALRELGWMEYLSGVYASLQAGDDLGKWLGMVFDKRAYGGADDVTKSREAWAQLVALHAVEPELMQSRMPEAHKFVEEAYANDRRAPEQSERARGATQQDEEVQPGRERSGQEVREQRPVERVEDQAAIKETLSKGVPATRAAIAKLDDAQRSAWRTWIMSALPNENSPTVRARMNDALKTLGEAPKSEVPSTKFAGRRENAQSVQKPRFDGNTADQKEMSDAVDAIRKRLGPDIKVAIGELFGADGKTPISGEFLNDVISVSIYARYPGQIGAHESMHALFARMTAGGPDATKAAGVLLRAASSQPVLRQLQRLLRDEPAALKQINAGPHAAEERLAYAYQFWQAGMLKIGPETESTFQKIKNFLRKFAGVLSDDQKTQKLFEAFEAGKMQDADAVARVLANDLEYRERLYKAGAEKLKPLGQRIGRLVNTTAQNLEVLDNPAASEIVRLFNRPVGEGGGQSFYEAKDQKFKQFSNKLLNAIDGVEKKDLELAAELLHTNGTTTDPVIRRTMVKVKRVLREMHSYMTEAGVMRFDEETKQWVPMGKIENYYPRVYDVAKIVAAPDKFVESLMTHNKADLDRIAGQAGATAEEVAEAIANRLTNAGGSDLDETVGAVGFTPMAQQVNKRTLHWIAPEVLKEFGEKDLAKVMTAYIAQGVKRAEYVRRFGNDGEVLQGKIEKLNAIELGKEMRKTHGMSDADFKKWEAAYAAEISKPKATPSKALEASSKALGLDVAKTQAAELKALERTSKAATDVMALEGTLGYNVNPKWRQFQNAAVTYQNLRVLGLSLFSQMIDPLGLMVRGGQMSDAFAAYKRGIKEVVASYKGERTQDEAAKIAEQVGTLDAHGMLAAYGQLHSSVYMAGKFRAINEGLFKYNGMEGFNRGMQIAATQSAINFIKRHVENPTKNSADYLAELNLKAADVKIMKDGNLDYRDPKIQNAIHRWVNGAVLRPNASQRPAWASDPHWMIFWHMKQFAYTFHDVTIKRALHDVKKYDDASAVAALVAGMVPVMVAADAAKSLLLTGSEPTWMKAGLGSEISHGVNRAGLLGQYQPIADSALGSHGLLGVAGPSVEQVGSLFVNTPGDSVINALPGASVIHTARSN